MGRFPTMQEVKELSVLQLEPSQAAWALVQYKRATLYPNARDFIEWQADGEPPSEIVAAAFLTEQPVAIEMAERLQTLQAAWYPTAGTKEVIADLEKRLRAAL